MSFELANASDAVSGGLVAGTQSGESALAMGYFTFECFDKDGNLKWREERHNMVVNVGIQYMAGTALTSTTQITAWYVGLIGPGSGNTYARTDTLASHSGWTEVTPYSGNRPAITFVAATNANPSVVTNSTAVSYSINATQTVGGAFLCSAASGTTGTLFSESNFQSPGDRSVVSGDTLNVTYTFSLTAA
jgi:hypothetical protein